MRRIGETVAMTAVLTLAACGSQDSGEALGRKTCDALKQTQATLEQPFDAVRVAEVGTELGNDIGFLSDPPTDGQQAAFIAFSETMTASEQPDAPNIEAARNAVNRALEQYC